MKNKGLQLRLLYPARFSIEMEGKITSFQDKSRLKEYNSTKLTLQDMLKDCFKKGKKKSEREEHRYKGSKMAMNKYLSITLNVNGVNAAIKRHRVAEWIRKHDQNICCLQETHLREKTYTD